MCITKSNINHTQRTYNKDISNIYHKITYTAHTPHILHTVISRALGTKHTTLEQILKERKQFIL